MAASRFEVMLSKNPEYIACLHNLTTAMRGINLPNRMPLDYLREIEWSQLAQDRFFAYARKDLVDQVVLAAAQGEFKSEFDPRAFHGDVTSSYKQIQFGEANIQFTFHEKTIKTVGDEAWIMVEPDIDYYDDAIAHALLEVVVDKATNSLTDPKTAYALHWMVGQHAGIPEFDPP